MTGAGGLPLWFAVLVVLSLVGMSGPAAADPVRTGAEHCVVNLAQDDPLNLRAGPGTRHPVLARLPYGRCGLTIRGAACRGNWCPVEDGHHAGWVHRRYIAAVSLPSSCLSPLARPHAVALRAWPSDGSRVLAHMTPESCGIALLPYQAEGWQKIRQGGREGWVRLSDLLITDGRGLTGQPAIRMHAMPALAAGDAARGQGCCRVPRWLARRRPHALSGCRIGGSAAAGSMKTGIAMSFVPKFPGIAFR
ncbi:SH3 domain-containing protein [Halovulum dunhuangense]|uniref:SH3 domain-containing protein n=1 Tax=Halovulum dunhuangense TaxID=1505036 RepID=A0A849L2H7_9RHOB|nr:SH3 domain-containing protein [Halovulum dunhuangense]NNU80432.1 SH3 domain-containing protein [Halovulum dunhuangense]